MAPPHTSRVRGDGATAVADASGAGPRALDIEAAGSQKQLGGSTQDTTKSSATSASSLHTRVTRRTNVSGNTPRRSTSNVYTLERHAPRSSRIASTVLSLVQRIVQLLLATDETSALVCTLLVCATDTVLQTVLIRRVAYTEIDWTTYMEQVRRVVELHEFDYHNLGGPTGPLVYPAGFVYLFAALYYATDRGTNILRAQMLFAALHVATVFVVGVFVMGRMRSTPAILPAILLFSKRLHSIYALRLFNDTWGTLLMATATVLFASRRPIASSAVFSAAVALKMNALLYLPGLLILLWYCCGVFGRRAGGTTLATPSAILCILVATIVQLVVALPFISLGPASHYWSQAFDFNRAFLYKWTVNWKMVPEQVFTSRTMSLSLLAMHVVSLILFLALLVYRARSPAFLMIGGGVHRSIGVGFGTTRPFFADRSSLVHDTTTGVTLILTCANMIGIVFARSLHYQFWSWYAFQVPIAVYCGLSAILRRVQRNHTHQNASYDDTPKSGTQSTASLIGASSHESSQLDREDGIHLIRWFRAIWYAHREQLSLLVATLIVFAALDKCWCTFPATATSSIMLLVLNIGTVLCAVAACVP